MAPDPAVPLKRPTIRMTPDPVPVPCAASHAEAVGMRIPASKFGLVAEEYCKLFSKEGLRPDQLGDRGTEYRNVVGIPGGVNSALAKELVAASVKQGDKLDFAAGKGDDADRRGLVWIYDTAQYPFYLGEVYHRARPGLKLSQRGQTLSWRTPPCMHSTVHRVPRRLRVWRGLPEGVQQPGGQEGQGRPAARRGVPQRDDGDWHRRAVSCLSREGCVSGACRGVRLVATVQRLRLLAERERERERDAREGEEFVVPRAVK